MNHEKEILLKTISEININVIDKTQIKKIENKYLDSLECKKDNENTVGLFKQEIKNMRKVKEEIPKVFECTNKHYENMLRDPMYIKMCLKRKNKNKILKIFRENTMDKPKMHNKFLSYTIINSFKNIIKGKFSFESEDCYNLLFIDFEI
uniref:Uncharacterized protein n=1 Tax=Stereomyxa ramosa TaxID=1078864 RepID=A0A7S2ABU4_9EUKA|mmetsp:Transcript_728/g.906  ORF Transcript_728/g.906 Transcript_728/m.906 type:complete len:149 (+) Transcript_728:546-992(+)